MTKQLSFLIGVILMCVSALGMAAGCLFVLAGDLNKAAACVALISITMLAVLLYSYLEETHGR